jgi:hypothetical protein
MGNVSHSGAFIIGKKSSAKLNTLSPRFCTETCRALPLRQNVLRDLKKDETIVQIPLPSRREPPEEGIEG